MHSFTRQVWTDEASSKVIELYSDILNGVDRAMLFGFKNLFRNILCLALVASILLQLKLAVGNDDVPGSGPPVQPNELQAPSSVDTAAVLPADVADALAQLETCMNTPVCTGGTTLVPYRNPSPCELAPDKLNTLRQFLDGMRREAVPGNGAIRVFRMASRISLACGLFIIGGYLVPNLPMRLEEMGLGWGVFGLLIGIASEYVYGAAIQQNAANTPTMRALQAAGYSPEWVNGVMESQILRNRGWFWRGLSRGRQAFRNAASATGNGVARFARSTAAEARRFRSRAGAVSSAAPGVPAPSAPAPVESTGVRIADAAGGRNPTVVPPEIRFRIGPDGNLCVLEESVDELAEAATQAAGAERQRGSQRISLVPPSPRRRRPVLRDFRPTSEGAYPRAVNFSREALSETTAVLPVGPSPAASSAEILVPVSH